MVTAQTERQRDRDGDGDRFKQSKWCSAPGKDSSIGADHWLQFAAGMRMSTTQRSVLLSHRHSRPARSAVSRNSTELQYKNGQRSRHWSKRHCRGLGTGSNRTAG